MFLLITVAISVYDYVAVPQFTNVWRPAERITAANIPDSGHWWP